MEGRRRAGTPRAGPPSASHPPFWAWILLGWVPLGVPSSPQPRSSAWAPPKVCRSIQAPIDRARMWPRARSISYSAMTGFRNIASASAARRSLTRHGSSPKTYVPAVKHPVLDRRRVPADRLRPPFLAQQVPWKRDSSTKLSTRRPGCPGCRAPGHPDRRLDPSAMAAISFHDRPGQGWAPGRGPAKHWGATGPSHAAPVIRPASKNAQNAACDPPGPTP